MSGFHSPSSLIKYPSNHGELDQGSVNTSILVPPIFDISVVLSLKPALFWTIGFITLFLRYNHPNINN